MSEQERKDRDLSRVIDHLHRNKPTLKPTDGVITYEALLSWLEELRWYRDSKPFPPGVQALRDGIVALFPGIRVNVTQPRYMGGVWWLDMDYGEESVSVEYYSKRDKPWGVSEIKGPEEPAYGQGPDEIYASPEEALVEIQRILSQ